MNEYTDHAVTSLDEAGAIIANKNIMVDIITDKLVAAEARIKELEKELAAAQAREVKLREALNTAADKFHDYAEYHSMKDRTRDNIEKVERNLELAKMCDAALALPSDTTALEALIQKAGDVAVAKARQACIDLGAKGIDYFNYAAFVESIRALPGVTLDDLKGGAA